MDLQKAAIIIFTAVCFVGLNRQVLNAQDSKTDGQAQTPTAAPASAQTSSTSTTPAPASLAAAPQTSPQAQTAGSTPSETAEALAHKYLDAWNTGDKAAIDSFPAFTMHNHGGHVVVGSSMLERVIANWRHSMPDLTFTVDDTVAQGDKVVMRVTLRGTYKELLFPEANFPKSPPRPIRATGILIFKVKDGKIQDIWQELDESAMKVQMGAQYKTRPELEAEDAASKSKKQEEAAPAKP
jgi:predicted ester cyclase